MQWCFHKKPDVFLLIFYAFKKDGNLYYRPEVDAKTISCIKLNISKAKKRVDNFWGEKIAVPKYIYCQDDEDYKKFGVPFMTPACANMKLGSCVVISKTGIDPDIISHETAHTKLNEKIGFFNKTHKIPSWFDEGLAMKLDFRSSFSTDS